MKDLIFIEGLSVFAQIGVYDWEQQIKQKLIFDVEMAWDTRQAAITDDVQYTLNYAEISQFFLIERVANEVADQLQRQFNISRLRLKLSKPKAVAQANNVGVIIERNR